MKPVLSFGCSAALAIAAICTLSGCNPFSDPPTQLEAKLFVAGTTIQDEKALARHLTEQLNIVGLEADQVRIAFDKEKNTYFFRMVGKEALPPALLKQVVAGLATLNRDLTWQGKLIVEAEADAKADAILKTNKREFAVTAPWNSVRVDAYLVTSAAENMLARLATAAGRPERPKQAACMLSFAPRDKLPPLTGKLSDFASGNGALAGLVHNPLFDQEVTLPHRITFSQPELAKLKEPVVDDGKLLFQFALVEDAKMTVIHTGGAGLDALVVDHGTVEHCKRKLREVAPDVQKLVDRFALLDEVSAIGPAQLVAKAR